MNYQVLGTAQFDISIIDINSISMKYFNFNSFGLFFVKTTSLTPSPQTLYQF